MLIPTFNKLCDIIIPSVILAHWRTKVREKILIHVTQIVIALDAPGNNTTADDSSIPDVRIFRCAGVVPFIGNHCHGTHTVINIKNSPYHFKRMFQRMCSYGNCWFPHTHIMHSWGVRNVCVNGIYRHATFLCD